MWIYNRGVLNKHEVKKIYKKGKIKYSNQQRKKEKKTILKEYLLV